MDSSTLSSEIPFPPRRVHGWTERKLASAVLKVSVADIAPQGGENPPYHQADDKNALRQLDCLVFVSVHIRALPPRDAMRNRRPGAGISRAFQGCPMKPLREAEWTEYQGPATFQPLLQAGLFPGQLKEAAVRRDG